MSATIETTAAQLKALRKAKGLSQRGLSALSGIPQPHIAKIEQGRTDLRLSSLTALTHALGHGVILAPRASMPLIGSILASSRPHTNGTYTTSTDEMHESPHPAFPPHTVFQGLDDNG